MNGMWKNDWYLLGVLADLEDGAVARRAAAGLDVAVFSAGGRVVAARDNCGSCSHSLAGATVRDNAVECPQCGLSLGFSDGPSDPADAGKARLSTFPVMVVDDEVFAWIEEPG